VEDVERDQAAELLDGVHQRQGGGAVVDVAAGLVLRPRADQQDADRRVEQRAGVVALARQAAAHPGGPGALEQEPVAVVQQLPGQAEQGGGGLLGLPAFFVARAVERRGIDIDREAPGGTGVDALPGGEHIGGAARWQGGLVEQLPSFPSSAWERLPRSSACGFAHPSYTPVAELPDESIIYNILNRKE